MALHRSLPATLEPMTPAMREVLKQLWLFGPTWDGNVVSKQGRNELVTRGWALHTNGHAYLTESGVALAVGLFGAKDK